MLLAASLGRQSGSEQRLGDRELQDNLSERRRGAASWRTARQCRSGHADIGHWVASQRRGGCGELGRRPLRGPPDVPVVSAANVVALQAPGTTPVAGTAEATSLWYRLPLRAGQLPWGASSDRATHQRRQGGRSVRFQPIFAVANSREGLRVNRRERPGAPPPRARPPAAVRPRAQIQDPTFASRIGRPGRACGLSRQSVG